MGEFISSVYRTKIGRELLRRTAIIASVYLVCMVVLTVFLSIKSNQIYTNNQKLDHLKSDLQTMMQALIDQETGQRGYILTGEKQFLEPYNSGTKTYVALSNSIKKEVRVYPMLYPPVQAMINKGFEWHDSYGAPQVMSKSIGIRITDDDLLNGKDHFDAFRSVSNTALTSTAAYEREQIQLLSKWIFFYHLGLILVSLILFGLLLYFILGSFQRLAQPITEVQEAVKELANGNFDYPLPKPSKKHNELTELVISLEIMRSKMERTLDQTKQLAETDALTGIFNRGYMDNQLAFLLSEFYLVGKSFGLIIFDLDKFKVFNDTYGHTEGDRLLKHVAGIISSQLQKEDLFARYGGEEFVVLTPAPDPVALAEHLRITIENTPLDSYMVTASFGVTFCQDGDGAKSLIDRADRALYLAKENGRNRVELGSN